MGRDLTLNIRDLLEDLKKKKKKKANVRHSLQSTYFKENAKAGRHC